MLDAIDKQLLLEKILDLNYLPDGAYHIRKNGQDIERINTENISIVPKKGQAGIDVTVKPGTRGETIYLFSLMSQPVADLVYNTFEIGANANIVIMAGYTLTDPEIFQQQVVNKFIVQENAKLKYIEKHSVDGVCQRVLNQKNILSVEKSG
ncbi:MAG: hypothetical protein LBR56_04080, partial [Sporomusaceae bacterium]|nr:hypothetical protein [Sporomusaceae bacterium]